MDHAEFDWDFENIRHIVLHAVTPEEAEDAYSSPLLFLEVQEAFGETRFFGSPSHAGWPHSELVTTARGSRVRIVTAYDSDKQTISRYFAEFGGL